MSAVPVTMIRRSTPRLRRPGQHISAQSRIGLNAANFFLAEIGGVVVPFLSKYLVECGWSDGSVGVAIALGALGVFVMQTPAGFIVDCIRQRRAFLAAASMLMGFCFGLLPLLPARWQYLDPLLFLGGMSRSFFAPLLRALALGLAGHAGLNRLVGTAQSFDHAGNLTSALVAICLLAWLPVTSIFYAVAAVSVLAAALVFVIRDNEVDDDLACGGRRKDQPAGGFLILLRDERVAILFAAIAVVAALLFVLLMPETRIDFAIPRRSGEL